MPMVLPASAALPKALMMRTSAMYDAVPMKLWNVADPEIEMIFPMTCGSSRTCGHRMLRRPSLRVRTYSWISTPVQRPMLVPMAAPATPRRGNGPMPKMRHGPSVMLIALAIHSTRIAMAASPVPRKTELMMNSSVTPPLAPSITRANRLPVDTTPSSGAHHPEKIRREQDAGDADHGADHQADDDRLHGSAGRAVVVAFADAPRDGRRRADREADGDCVDDRHQRFGDADGGDGVGEAEAADEEDVRHGEHRLHQHLEDHRDREQEHRPADGHPGEVGRRSANGFAERRPDRPGV